MSEDIYVVDRDVLEYTDNVHICIRQYAVMGRQIEFRRNYGEFN